MQAPSGQMTAPVVRALLEEGALAGTWALDPGRSGIRLKSKVMGLIPVNGVFREIGGNGTVSADGQVSGIVTIAAASVHGDGEIWLDARVRVNRTDFGLTWNWLGLVSVTSALTIHAVFTR